MNTRTSALRFQDFGLPVGVSDVDRVAAQHAETTPHGHRLAHGGDGCRGCAKLLTELWPAATESRLHAALLDRQDELDRRRADQIPDDAQPVDDLPLLSCQACSVIRLGYEVTGWPGVEYRCQHCGKPWTARRRLGMYGRRALTCPICQADSRADPDDVSTDPLEEYACLECGCLWSPDGPDSGRLAWKAARFGRRVLRRITAWRTGLDPIAAEILRDRKWLR